MAFLWHRRSPHRRSPRPSRALRAFRPSLERLESRTLLTSGGLDPTFGNGGKVLTGFQGSFEDTPQAIARQSDGKLVVAGQSRGGSIQYLALARYGLDGSLDPTFGTDGRALIPFGLIQPDVAALAVQADGKLVVAGTFAEYTANAPVSDFLVLRCNADGSLDTTFGGGDGKVTTDFGTGYDLGKALLVQPDGKLVAVGTSSLQGTNDVALARYNADGSLDQTFGTGGLVAPRVPYNLINAAVLQADGKVVVAGTAPEARPDASTIDFALRCFNVDGTLDTTFGVGGLALAGFVGSDEVALALARQPDGKLVVGGEAISNDRSSSLFALARFNPEGSVDPSFGSGGTVTTDFGPPQRELINGLAVQGDGRILATAGPRSGDDSQTVGLARYNADGSLDVTFGNGGRATTSLGSGHAAVGLVLAGSGIVVAAPADGGGGGDFGLVRFNPDGSLDATFGTAGKATSDFIGPASAAATSVTRLPDGKLLATGHAVSGITSGFALARYNADGSLDDTFGSGGKIVTYFDSVGNVYAASSVLQPDGKLVVAGYAGTSVALARYQPDGSLDPTFGTGGKVTIGQADRFAQANAVALQSDGKIVVAGEQYDGLTFTGLLLRFSPDGRWDTSFTGGGLAGFRLLTDLVVQPDDKIVITGQLEGTGTFAVDRVNADGSADLAFGTDGRTVVRFGTGVDAPGGVALQSDGRIVAAATHYDIPQFRNSSALALVRLLPDGTADSSFGLNGQVETAQGLGGGTWPMSVVVKPNGKIAASGFAIFNGGDFGVVVYLPDGSLEGDFGLVTTDFAGDLDAPQAIQWQPDGKLVVAGSATVDGNPQFALARYEDDTNASPTPTDDNVRFVTNLYGDLLLRGADESGLRNATAGLDAARQRARESVAIGFATSVEYRSDLLAGYYTTFLHRPASPGEVHIWLAVLQGGGTPEQVLGGIVASDEYFQKAGNTNAKWLDQVYRDLLGRDPDSGSQVFLDCLNAGACTRAQVAASVLASAEYRSLFVAQVFDKFLGRQPDPSEIQPWEQFLALPGSSEPFLAAVLASAEYFHHNGNVNQLWLDSLYRRLLNRLPDAPGYDANLQNLLSRYASQRQGAASGILFSDEYRRKTVGDAYQRFLRRSGGPSEIEGWVEALRRGVTQEQVVAGIMASNEYFQKPGGTNAQWLDQLYRDLLGRGRDTGSQGFLHCLNQGICTREQVAFSILASVEYRRALLQSYYRTFLRRIASDAEIASWVQSLQRGNPQEQVLGNILASNEYFLQAGQAR